MTPIAISAKLTEGFVVSHPIHLDSILSAAVAIRDGLVVPPTSASECKRFDLPIARSGCDRYWLASVGEYQSVSQEIRYKNARAPWIEYARLGGSKIRRVQLSTGHNKSYRSPYELSIPAGGIIVWWAIGYKVECENLLGLVHYMGKYRGTGKGKISRWEVSECESWGDGFPVTRDGEPMRNMPSSSGAMLRCEPPYWMRDGRVPCVAPVSQ